MPDLDGLRVVVTGGAGFIGSEVTRQLHNRNADVTVFDNFSSGKVEYLRDCRDSITIVKGDVYDKEAVSRMLKDQEVVIHLAALPFIPDCYYHPEEFFKVNTEGSVITLQESIRTETVKKFIHISSSEVYGTARYVPMNEEHPTFPHSTYAVSKLAADRAVFTMCKEHNFPAVVIRPFNSYGPNITQPYIVPEILLQLSMQNDRISLGNVESSRDFTYVTDTARGIILALIQKNAVGETINIGSGREVKIKDLVFLVAELLGKQVSIEVDSTRFRPCDVERLICDNTKAQKILGWQPKIPLEEGLKLTYEWMKKNHVGFKVPFKGWRAYYNDRRTKYV